MTENASRKLSDAESDLLLRRRNYDRIIIRNIIFHAMAYPGMKTPRLIAANGIPAEHEWQRILQRSTQGRGLTKPEIEDLTDTEYVLYDANGSYAAVETALLADVEDVGRARRCADLIAKANDHPAIAALICPASTEDAHTAAQEQEVTLLHMREKPPRL